MTNSIVGTLPVNHSVDPNGSFSINIPLQLPQAKIMPDISLAYHSAANSPSAVGLGWAIKGASLIERVPATKAQDNLRGVVNYDEHDRFALDGQRLIRLTPTSNEYRFELERWSKLVAQGSNPANPDSWVEHLPDGTKRTFGATKDSNLKSHEGSTATRVWAISEHYDAFSNYISFSYKNDAKNGSLYLAKVAYGGNRSMKLAHQREVVLDYEARPDKRTRYMGGHKICIDKRLASITSLVKATLVHTHLLQYDIAPLTATSRLREVTLADKSGAKVRPLRFDWIDGNPTVFDGLRQIATIKDVISEAQIIPMDVHASGRSDIVIASNQLGPDGDNEELHLTVHQADGQGGVSELPLPHGGPTGLSPATQLLPLDTNGDGKIDLLHIGSSTDEYTLTVLLSTPDGYKRQGSSSYKPESMEGHFYSGDFVGTGGVGLIYVCSIDTSQIKIDQFTSKNNMFTVSSSFDGPKGFGIDVTKVIVGDLNGNGVEDVFLIAHKKKGEGEVCHINLVESVNGTLTYRANHQPLISSGESVPWTESTTFLPYAADGDGKTSLLVLSQDPDQNLQWQLLRNTGSSFSPPAPPQTPSNSISFDGNIILAKTSSTYSVDLINTFNSETSGIEVNVLRFDGEKFTRVGTVRQPGSDTSGSSVRWADLRGVGRVDCTMNAFDNTSGSVTIYSMPCSSSQPVDFVSGYEHGLGAKISVVYAPLSDTDIYTTTHGAPRTTTAALNAMACNVTSSVSLNTAPPTSAQTIGHTRTELVHFPAFVVKTLSNCPRKTQPKVVDHRSYKYENARIAFDGRGWLGFESIAKSLQPQGVRETTSYHQDFPFLGQTSMVKSEDTRGNTLRKNTYTWKAPSIHSGHNRSVLLQSCREAYYEAGVPSHHVDVSYQYDSYANNTQLDIVPSQPNVPALSINSKFHNNEVAWVIGSKIDEIVKQQRTILKHTKYVYVDGTRVSSQTSKWADGSTWTTQSFKFDGAGNEILVEGPGRSKRSFTYDETHSNVVSASTFTGHDAGSALTERATYDLALGKPLSVTDANGHIISRTYDVLGRVKDVSEGTSSSDMVVVEKHSFQTEGDEFFQSRQVWAGSSVHDTQWSTTKAYFDGLKQVWKTERPRPDDLSAMICSEVQYDGAGRITARSRDYLSKSAPVFTKYTYDAQSRVVTEVCPADASPITTSFQYKFERGLAKVTETRSDGKANQLITRELQYLANPEPSAGRFVKPFVTCLINELGHTIRTSFDGLGRSIAVKDGSDVELSLKWDGLSRQVGQHISKVGSTESNTISHLSVTYEDDTHQTTVKNELMGSKVVMKTDLMHRPISKTTKKGNKDEETLTFTYDKGGENPKERLVNVASSHGVKHHFDYDIKGRLVRSRLSIDGLDFTTSHQWTPAGQLLKTTNPDKTLVTRSFLADGKTLGKVELSDTKNVRASLTFSGYDNIFSRPLLCNLGNGIKSTSRAASDGSLTSTSLSLGSNRLNQQHWKHDTFGRIEGYDVDHSGLQSIRSSFQYDTAGQLLHRVSDPSAVPAASTEHETFTYDESGNLSSKDGKTFVRDGWQLKSIHRQGKTESSFKYSADGNLTAKLNDKGTETSSMKYDSDGRLVELDKTTFVYDFGGRLIKSISPTKDVRIYPSQTYEVDIPASGVKSHTAYLVHGYRRASLTTVDGSSEKPGSSTVYYFHSDHLGSTIAASDEKGKMVTRYQYDPFGKVTVHGRDVARYKFSGKEQFGGLYYFGARFYDPDTGRFLTLDNHPISLRQISPSTFNMYTFSRNDPINFIDLNGNVPWWHWAVDVALIGLGVAATFIPVPGLNNIISGTLIGAGFSGLIYDAKAVFSHNGAYKDSDWGIQLGLGAAVGFVSGGVLGILDAAGAPAVSFLEATGARGVAAGSMEGAAGVVGTTALRLTVMGVTGSVTSVLKQMAENAIEKEPLNEGLGNAAWMGAVTGIATQGLSEGWAFKPFSPMKFWKGKTMGGYNVAGSGAETKLLPGLMGEVRYPLAQASSKELKELAQAGSRIKLTGHNESSFDSPSFDTSSLDFSTRYLPTRDATSL